MKCWRALMWRFGQHRVKGEDTVTPPIPPPDPVLSVIGTPASFSQQAGQTQAVAFRAYSGLAGAGIELTGRVITLASNNPPVATVSPASSTTPVLASVPCVSAGTATITATCEGVDGTSVATVTAIVTPVGSVVPTPSSYSQQAGSPQIVTYRTWSGPNGTGTQLTGRAVAFNSSNTAAVTGSPASGVSPLVVTMTNIAVGTSTLTATSEGVSGVCAATVTAAQSNAPALPLTWNTIVPDPLVWIDPVVTGNPVTNMTNVRNAVSQANIAFVQTGVRINPTEYHAGTLELPASGSRTWFVKLRVRDTERANFPATGTRADPVAGNVTFADYWKIQCNLNNQPAITCADGAGYYAIENMRVDRGATTAQTYLVNIVVKNSPGDLTKYPKHIYLRHCWFYEDGTAAGGKTRVGLRHEGSYIALNDSYMEGIWQAGNEAKGVMAIFGPGPFQTYNNFIEAAGINVLGGGTIAPLPGLVPADWDVARNHIFKRQAWNQNNPAQWDGVAGRPIKNLYEYKAGERLRLEGNILDGSWVSSQTGFIGVLWSTSQSPGNPTSVCQDITVRYNILKNGNQGWQLNGTYSGAVTNTSLKRVAITHNVYVGMNLSTTGGGTRTTYQFNPNHADGLDDITIEHNTGNTTTNLMSLLSLTGVSDRFKFRSNVCRDNTYDFFASTARNLAALNSWCPGHDTTRNVFSNMQNVGGIPPNNIQVGSDAAILFTNLAAYDAGDISGAVLQAGSPGKNAAHDGTDCGADIPQVLAYTAGCVSGSWP